MHGMCSSRNRHHDGFQHWEQERDDVATSVAVAQRDPSERVGDADRERAAAVLAQAFRDGVLRVEEFDERLSAAYAAATVSDLEAVMRDLPRDWAEELRTAERSRHRAQLHRRAWRAGFHTYRRVLLLLVAIWGTTSLAAGDLLYPWPIWPALGWGIPLFLSRPRGRTTMPPWDYRSASSKT